MSTLFVIDDNLIDQQIIKFNLLKNPTFDFVLYFDGGLSLVNYINKHQGDYHNLPDTIFLDLRMPGYDGWKVLDELKKMYPMLSKKTKVYIITASISPVDIKRAESYKFVERFISKPFTKQVLLSISKESLN
jgi:CheY-like chemotaxis protein